MAVTLPLLLLLLDYWPLGRFVKAGRGGRMMNRADRGSSRHPRLSLVPSLALVGCRKVPMLAIAGFFCLVAVSGQEAAMEVNKSIPSRGGSPTR